MEPAVPMVFVGDIKGQLENALSKLMKVTKSMTTPECQVTVFVCGDFFGNARSTYHDYLVGSKRVQTPLYILGAVSEEQAAVFSNSSEMTDIMPNVTYLGKYGVLTLAEGLTIAYLSGVESSKQEVWTFTEEDIKALIRKCNLSPKIDVLVTYQWPKGLENTVSENLIAVASPSNLISRLVATVKPRLHFAANEQISFVSPYMSHETDRRRFTVFNGLTSFDKYKEGKWVCGIKLPIVDKGIAPSHSIPLPFSSQTDPTNPIFFDTKSKPKDVPSDQMRRRRNVEVVVDPTRCWFCLGNPTVDRSLIIAVADHVYLSLPKGPIVEDHVIILPIKHIPKMTDAPSGVEIETHRFLESLSQYYATIGKVLIWYERCYKSPHLQINAIPVDPKLVSLGIIDSHLSDLAKENQLVARSFNLRTVVNLRKNITSTYYFYLQIGIERGYLIDITKEIDFPINLGRKILTRTLSVPDRELWKNCVESEAAVSRSVARFRCKFEPFNFTLTD